MKKDIPLANKLELHNTEQILIQYYQDIYKLKLLKSKLKLFNDEKITLEKELKNNNMKLTSSLKSQQFLTITEDITKPTKHQNIVEHAYSTMEIRVFHLLTQIYELQPQIITLEAHLHDIEYILHSIKNDYEDFYKYIDLRYNLKQSIITISFELHLSESSVCRLKPYALSCFYQRYINTINSNDLHYIDIDNEHINYIAQ